MNDAELRSYNAIIVPLGMVTDRIRRTKLTLHNNLYSDTRNYGSVYLDQDVVVDVELIAGRNDDRCNAFAAEIIRRLQ